MVNNQSNFGIPKREKVQDQYIGQYVIIYPSTGNNNFAGKVTDIQDGFAILNPYQGGYCTKEGFVKKMIDKNALVDIAHANAVEPTTEENLENFCELWNSGNKIKTLKILVKE